MTDKQTEAMKAALTALKSIDEAMPFPVAKFAIRQLEEALAEQPAQRTWEEWFKWWRTSKVSDSTEAEIDFADFMLIVRAVESEYGIKGNT